MAWAAVAGAAVGVVGGALSSRSAAGAQTDAANQANQTQLAMYEQQRADAEPWRQAGMTALGQLGTGTAAGGEFNRNFGPADFQADPGYQFRQQQGQQALERSAAARGGLLSGGTLKALTRYGQDVASAEYGNAYNRFNNDQTTRFNRLSSLAGIGQTASRDVAQMGMSTAGAVAGNQLSAGNSAAAGYMATGNAINNGVNQGMSMYYLNQLNKPQGQQQRSFGPYLDGFYGGTGGSGD